MKAKTKPEKGVYVPQPQDLNQQMDERFKEIQVVANIAPMV